MREKKNLQDLSGVYVFNVAEREHFDSLTARFIKEFDRIEDASTVDETSRPPTSRQLSFESPVEKLRLIQMMLWLIRYRIALRSVSKVNDEWFADEEKVRKIVGLLEEPRENYASTCSVWYWVLNLSHVSISNVCSKIFGPTNPYYY